MLQCCKFPYLNAVILPFGCFETLSSVGDSTVLYLPELRGIELGSWQMPLSVRTLLCHQVFRKMCNLHYYIFFIRGTYNSFNMHWNRECSLFLLFYIKWRFPVIFFFFLQNIFNTCFIYLHLVVTHVLKYLMNQLNNTKNALLLISCLDFRSAVC